MKLTTDQEAVRDAYKEWTENIGMRDNNLQYVFTPYNLCEEMVLKLKENTGLKKKNILVFNLEFAIVLMERGVAPGNITFLTDCTEKVLFAEELGVNIMQEDFRKVIEEKRDLGQFDVVVGNPPYQDSSGNIGNVIWDKFTLLALQELTIDKGYLVFVHPPKWRNPSSPLWNMMKAKQIHYLEMHDVSDGQKTFGATTNYDWYVLQNTDVYCETTIKDINGENYIVDLTDIQFIPNSMFNFVQTLITSNEDDQIGLLVSYSDYEIRKSWMSKTKTQQHIYPCIRYISEKDGDIACWYSNTNQNGHFGIPKIVFGIGCGCGEFYFDRNGEYGLSQYAAGVLADTEEELENIYKAMNTPKFMEVMDACMTTTQRIHPKVFGMFKKDFWKEFIDDENK